MIEKMEKLFIYGLSDDTANLVKSLMKCGCVEISDPRVLSGSEEETPLVEKRSETLYELEQKGAKIASVITTLAQYSPKKKLFAPRDEVDFDSLEDSKLIEKAMKVCDESDRIQKELAQLKSQQGRQMFERDSLLPWKNLDITLGTTSTKTCQVRLMTLPLAINPDDMSTELQTAGVCADVEVVSTDKDMHYLVLFATNDNFAQAEELLRQYSGSRINFNATGTPKDEISKCEAEIKRLDKEISAKETEMEKLGEQSDMLKTVYDAVSVHTDCEKAGEMLLHTETTAVLGAWVPVRQKSRVEAVLDKYTCYYEYKEPENAEEPPVLLRNHPLIRPFETVTEMYSLPAYYGYDPNAVMAPFFFIFFGMMLSDAGYGLILAVAGFWLSKKMGGSKLMTMLGYCGLSTIFWGILYGGIFGDAITVIAKTFFGIDYVLPALINPLEEPMTILIMSFAFGAIHLFVGLGVQAYMLIKRGHPWAALFDVGFWYFVLMGLPLALLGGVVGQIGTYVAITGAIGLVLTQGRDKKNPILKFTSGLLSLYGITGYFSDVLSYSRIMALGLATGVIASVVNTMGSMGGANIVGAIMFLAVFVFGHLLNLAINALGSYVHTSRLQYVEFFGKFFEGGGKPFAPLRINTQYINVINKEEI